MCFGCNYDSKVILFSVRLFYGYLSVKQTYTIANLHSMFVLIQPCLLKAFKFLWKNNLDNLSLLSTYIILIFSVAIYVLIAPLF